MHLSSLPTLLFLTSLLPIIAAAPVASPAPAFILPPLRLDEDSTDVTHVAPAKVYPAMDDDIDSATRVEAPSALNLSGETSDIEPIARAESPPSLAGDKGLQKRKNIFHKTLDKFNHAAEAQCTDNFGGYNCG